MPKGNLAFKERDARRAIRAVTKEGIAVDRVVIDPRTGNIVVIAKPGPEDNEKNDFDGD